MFFMTHENYAHMQIICKCTKVIYSYSCIYINILMIYFHQTLLSDPMLKEYQYYFYPFLS